MVGGVEHELGAEDLRHVCLPGDLEAVDAGVEACRRAVHEQLHGLKAGVEMRDRVLDRLLGAYRLGSEDATVFGTAGQGRPRSLSTGPATWPQAIGD